MDSAFFGDFSGARRGTAPAARTPAFDEDVLGIRSSKDDQKTEEQRAREGKEAMQHMEFALDWLRGPPGMLGGSSLLPPLPATLGAAASSSASSVRAAEVKRSPPRAPTWPGEGRWLPATRVLRIEATPVVARDALRLFFDSGVVPCEIVENQEAWMFGGTAFVEFVACEVEVGVFESDASTTPSATHVVLRHTSANDVVRFSEFANRVLEFLRSRDLAARVERRGVAVVSAATTVSTPSFTSFEDIDEEDFSPARGDVMEESWDIRIRSALEGANRGGGAAREEAWQSLARWGENSPTSRSPLARALFSGAPGSTLVSRAFKAGPATPLSEMYPLAVALRCASLGLAEAAAVAEADRGGLACLLAAAEHSPKLVADELKEVVQRLNAGG